MHALFHRTLPSTAPFQRLARVSLLIASVFAGGFLEDARAAEVPSPKRRTCLVVCPPAFRDSLEPWIEHRAAQGVEVRLVPAAATAMETRGELLAAGLDRSTAAVMLIGKCRITHAESADTTRETPTFYRSPGPSAKFGTTPTLAGDAPYADVDGDGIPDVPIGRLPVTTVEQLSELVQRIIGYESSSDFGAWRDTVQITAGVGGFGALADAAIESATRSVLTTAVPESTRLCVTYCSPNSDFNPGPEDFFKCVVQRYQEGSLFWVYMGHGQITQLDQVPGPNGSRKPVLAINDLPMLDRPATAAPIAIMLACYTGAFDATDDCLAERMLLTPGGPIAVLAGSRVTMPYGNAIAAQGLIKAVYKDKTQRLGDAWLAAQRELATDSQENPQVAERRQLVDMLAAAVSPVAEMLPEERFEHIHLYNLLGDPLLQLMHPEAITLEVPRGIVAGQPLQIRGVAPHHGDLVLSVRYLPGSVPVDRQLSSLQRYLQANEGHVVVHKIPGQSPGPFEATLELPANLRGPMHVVARIENGTTWSVGAKRILVRPQRQ